MRRYQSKTRLETKGTSLEGEDLSENEQRLEDITERFEESKRRSKADTQERQPIYIESEEKKAQEMRKKQWKDLERQKREAQDESDTADRNIAEGVVQKRLVFIRFTREKLEQSRKFKSEDKKKQSKGSSEKRA